MDTFRCAQRGCEFEAEQQPENCLICNNPFVEHPGADSGGIPWTDYSKAELQAQAKDWDLNDYSRFTKAELIALLEIAEAEAEAEDLETAA